MLSELRKATKQAVPPVMPQRAMQQHSPRLGRTKGCFLIFYPLRSSQDCSGDVRTVHVMLCEPSFKRGKPSPHACLFLQWQVYSPLHNVQHRASRNKSTWSHDTAAKFETGPSSPGAAVRGDRSVLHARDVALQRCVNLPSSSWEQLGSVGTVHSPTTKRRAVHRHRHDRRRCGIPSSN